MSLLSDLLDVVEHVVRTHPTWNQTLTQDQALAKIAEARAADAAHQAAHGNIVGAVQDVAEVVTSPLVEEAQKVEQAAHSLFSHLTHHGGGTATPVSAPGVTAVPPVTPGSDANLGG